MMKKKTFLKSILIVFLLIGIMRVGTDFLKNQASQTLSDKTLGWRFPVSKFPLTGLKGKQIAYSDIRDPGGVPQGLPVRLKIPIIGVDSAIEDALITPDGRMDVPEGSVNVAWFSLGPAPGQVGSAVIGGHFGFKNGVPFVFYNLDKLKIGDKVYIEDDKGDTLAFIVRSIRSFDRNADASGVFTSQDGLSHLNLITCEGVWNQVNDSYPQRLVIFTDSIPSEGAVVVDKGKVANAVSKPTAVSEVLPTKTDETATKSSMEEPLSSDRILIASARSLYKTPMDGLITSFLLFSIVFMAYKIIKRWI